MRSPIYNLAINTALIRVPIPNHRIRSIRSAIGLGIVHRRLFFVSLVAGLIATSFCLSAAAADWHAPEQQLARKIATITGPGSAALKIENRSSLERRDVEAIQNGLRAELEATGLRFVAPEQSAVAINITLSENASSYVWVAEIHQSAGDSAVAIVSVPRAGSVVAPHDSVPMELHKVLLWSQEARILDLAVLDETATGPDEIAVLDAAKVSIYRMAGGKWTLEQSLEIAHSRPWPRDLRGRLIVGKERWLDVYLPGVSCHGGTTAPITLNCRNSEDPWPIGFAAAPLSAFFSPTRNFFTGTIHPAIGKFSSVAKFYSAVPLLRDKYALWLFAATDGQLHWIDGLNDQSANFGWGPDIAALKTNCGSGWQILASSDGDQTQDSIRGYEFPDRDPVAVSAAVELAGTITAMWTESKGDTAVVVARNANTGSYEAYRLSIACNP